MHWNIIGVALVDPVIFIFLLTLLGIIFSFRGIIALAGLIAIILCYIPYKYCEFTIEFAFNWRTGKYNQRYWFKILNSIYSINRSLLLISYIPTEFALIVRLFFLTVAMGLADFFNSICTNGSNIFLKDFSKIMIVAIITIGLTLFDMLRDKDIDKQGIFIRLISIAGALGFYINFVRLFYFLDGTKGEELIKLLDSKAFWFINFNPIKEFGVMIVQALQRHLNGNEPLIQFPFMLVFLYFALVVFIKLSFQQLLSATEPLRTDKQNFAIAKLLLCIWLFPLPLCI